MESQERTKLTVSTTINASPEKVWICFNEPEHLTKWCAASDDWHMPSASNDLKVGGQFNNRMEAKDGSFGFDFKGTYTNVMAHSKISYVMEDSRTVDITFENSASGTYLEETFEAESENPLDMQQAGWQAILDNFKKYVEAL
jgi:uncharacterized protein YndB with AHSA1/START domain